MSTVRKPRPRVKPARSLRYYQPPAGSAYRILDITEGERLTCYFVLSLPSDFGRCFRLEKVHCHRRGDEPDRYDVCLADAVRAGRPLQLVVRLLRLPGVGVSFDVRPDDGSTPAQAGPVPATVPAMTAHERAGPGSVAGRPSGPA